ncbi:hypothetical protein ACFVAV_00245 [Nocardia sp. NPDC057663]|uniref:hypothetical protein n=1 Tax=Nocardia sp. NPDC057663 TaxID=3346201 RepID=UPI00367000AE
MPIVELPGQEGFVTRLREVVHSGAPWHRRLWRGGTLQIAQELLDESVTPGMPDRAIEDLRISSSMNTYGGCPANTC